MYNFLSLVMCILASYGIVTIISAYDGPFGIFVRIRSKFMSLFSCNVCLLPYAALMSFAFTDLGLVGYLATIGGGVLLARLA